MKTFKEYINEGAINVCALFMKDNFKQVNPRDHKNYVHITATSKGADLVVFTIAYDTLDGKPLTQDEFNDLWDNDKDAHARSERSQLTLKKMKKDWKVFTKTKPRGDFEGLTGTKTDDEVMEILNKLPLKG